MAKQTFTTGQVLSAAQVNALQANDYNTTVSTKTASYVLVAADVGTTIVQNVATANTVTVNTGLFAAGDTLRIQNIGAGIATVTAGTATVNTANSLALPQWGSGILYFTSASAAIFFPSAGAAAAAGGMTLIKRETFSAVTDTSTTFDSLFTTTYDTYLIVMAVKGSTGGALFRFQFRKIAVTQASGYYGAAQELNFVGTASTILNNNTAHLEPCRSDTTNTFDLVMYANGVGTGVSQSAYISGHSFEPSGLKTANFGGANITAGLYDGFILSASAGTITGQVAVYGLAKS
jgi:hypothetical protein